MAEFERPCIRQSIETTSTQQHEEISPDLIDFYIEEGIVETREEATEIILYERAHRKRVAEGLTPAEKDVYLKEGYSKDLDETDPVRYYKFLKERDLKIVHQAQENVLKELESAGRQCDEWEYQTRLEEEIQRLKYFPVMFVAAPNIKGDSSGNFPGVATPLLYALSVVDRYVRSDTFPAQQSPEIVGLHDPGVYSPEFVDEFTEQLRQTRPRVLGISNTSEGHYFGLEIARIAKQIAQEEGWEIITIMGGAHEDGTNPEPYFEGKIEEKFQVQEGDRPALEAQSTLADEESRQLVDVVVAGDGQYVLVDLLKIIGDNSQLSNAELLKKIGGIEEDGTRINPFAETEGSGDVFVHQKENGEVVHLDLKGTTLNGEMLPFIYYGRIDRELNFGELFVKEENGKRRPKKTAQVMTAMGCPRACDYCQESVRMYNLWKARSVENIIKELRILHDYGFEATFFDDSTFTRSPGKIWNLSKEMVGMQKNEGIGYEWGCQTSFVNIPDSLAIRATNESGQSVIETHTDREFLAKMKEAGCSYIYFGFEQLEDIIHLDKARKLLIAILQEKFGITAQEANKFDVDQLDPAVYQSIEEEMKDRWKRQVEKIALLCKEVGIRVGVSIQLGVHDTENYKETIDYIAYLCKEGLIDKGSIGLNVNVTYPGTQQYIEKIQKGEINQDWTDPLIRHPRFEAAHQMAAFTFEKFNEIWAYARPKLGEGLMGVKVNDAEVAKWLKQYAEAISRDFYFDEDKYGEYLGKVRPALHLNHASLSEPCDKALEIAESLISNEHSKVEKRAMVEAARRKAAELVGLKDYRGTALCRNTTEASSLCVWLSGLKEKDHVLLTNAENKSIKRAFEVHMDHGNPDGDDRWSTYPTYYNRRGKRYKGEDILPTPTGARTTEIDVINSSDRKIFKHIEKSIGPKTKVFVVSHVIRDNGRLLPIKEICQHVREAKARAAQKQAKKEGRPVRPEDQEIFILVDGAQALGNVEQVNFDDLGCDAYMATPHKTMYSTPVGLLFFNPDNSTIQKNLPKLNELFFQDEQIILDHMFAPEMNIKPNVADEVEAADICGFSAAVDNLKQHGYQEGDFSAISEKRRSLKEQFKGMIIEMAKEKRVRIREAPKGTNFIYSFNICGINNREFVKQLAANDIFVSYIDRSRLGEDGTIRVSFGMGNSPEQLDQYRQNFERALETVIGEAVRETRETIADRFIFGRERVTIGLMDWLRGKALSPVGRVAAVASGLVTVMGAATWMFTRSSKEIAMDPKFIQAEQVALVEANKKIASIREDMKKWGPSRASSDYEVDLKSEAYKYEVLLKLGNERDLNNVLDEDTLIVLRNAEFTETEMKAMQNTYNQTSNEKLGRLLQSLGVLKERNEEGTATA